MKVFVNRPVVVVRMGEKFGDQDSRIDAYQYLYNRLIRAYRKDYFAELREEYVKHAIDALVTAAVIQHVRPQYSGKAKCSPEDAFNRELGIELAKARMLEKYYLDVSVAANEVACVLEALLEGSEAADGQATESQISWVEREVAAMNEAVRNPYMHTCGLAGAKRNVAPQREAPAGKPTVVRINSDNFDKDDLDLDELAKLTAREMQELLNEPELDEELERLREEIYYSGVPAEQVEDVIDNLMQQVVEIVAMRHAPRGMVH